MSKRKFEIQSTPLANFRSRDDLQYSSYSSTPVTPVLQHSLHYSNTHSSTPVLQHSNALQPPTPSLRTFAYLCARPFPGLKQTRTLNRRSQRKLRILGSRLAEDALRGKNSRETRTPATDLRVGEASRFASVSRRSKAGRCAHLSAFADTPTRRYADTPT